MPPTTQILLILLTVLGCGEGAETGGGAEPPDTGAPGDTDSAPAASVEGLRIEPELATTTDDLECLWDDLVGASSVQITWFTRGLPVEGQGGTTLSSDYTAKGMLVQCEVIPQVEGGEPSLAEISIRNTPPVVESVTISPEQPSELDSVLTADITYSDVDEEPAWIYDFHYIWAVNGREVGYDEPALGRAYWEKGDRVEVRGWMRDGASSNVLAAEPVIIGDAPPSAPAVAFTGGLAPGEDLRCEVVEPSADLDGDAVRYTQSWRRFGLPAGLDLRCEDDQSACTLDGDQVEAGASYTCEVLPTDGELDGEPGSDTAAIGGAVIRYIWRSGYAAGRAAAELMSGDDLDGDGEAELVLGAPRASESSTNAGAVLVLGSAAFDEDSLVDDPVIRTLYGTQTESRFGEALALMPDMDGDGERELIVGAPGMDYAIAADAGAAYLYLSGSWDGPLRDDQDYDQAFMSYNELELTGSAVGAADWDGDGAAELVVGVPDRFDLDAVKGGVMIFPDFALGGSVPLTTLPDDGMAALLGEGRGEGARLATLDLSGDGVAELVVQARDADRLLVIDGTDLEGSFAPSQGDSGSIGNLGDRVSYEIVGTAGEDLGRDMAALTLSGGEAGLLVAGPGSSGAVYVWRWSDGSLGASELALRASGREDQALGSAVAVVQRGPETLVAMGAEADDSTYEGAGAVWLVPLSDWEAEGTISPGDGRVAWTGLYGEEQDIGFGGSLAAPGDWDGDGLGDIAVGAPGMDRSGVGFDVGGIAAWVDY